MAWARALSLGTAGPPVLKLCTARARDTARAGPRAPGTAAVCSPPPDMEQADPPDTATVFPPAPDTAPAGPRAPGTAVVSPPALDTVAGGPRAQDTGAAYPRVPGTAPAGRTTPDTALVGRTAPVGRTSLDMVLDTVRVVQIAAPQRIPAPGPKLRILEPAL